MKIILKDDIQNLILPLPIYSNIYIADVISKEGEKFLVFIGLDKNHALQLKNYSLNLDDIELQKNTADLRRFGIESYENWYKKNRTPFALIHESTNTLAAIIWFGPESLFDDKNNWHTVAWRSYAPFRGKGIMKDFSSFTMDFYLKYFPNICLWLSVKKENTGSQNLASYLGFKISEEKSNNNSLFMVKM